MSLKTTTYFRSAIKIFFIEHPSDIFNGWGKFNLDFFEYLFHAVKKQLQGMWWELQIQFLANNAGSPPIKSCRSALYQHTGCLHRILLAEVEFVLNAS